MFKHGLWSLTLLLVIACGEKSGHSDTPDAGSTLDAAMSGDSGAIPDAASEVDSGDDGPGDVERDYCAPLAALVCGRGTECGCGALVPGGTLDTAGCTARWTQKCLTAYEPYVRATAMGKARVIKSAARECISLITTLTPACEQPRGVVSFALCAPFVVSSTKISEACSDVPICADGEGVCREGVCVARGEKDAVCNSEFDCATGLLCASGTCQAPQAESAECNDDNACAPPLRCVLGSCAAPLAEGTACEDSAQCAQGLVCTAEKCSVPASVCGDDLSCGPRRSCGALRSCEARLGVDATCASDRDCTSDLYCNGEGKCTALPGLDQACANGAACAAGLACDPSGAEDARCLALPANGQPCALTPSGPFACAAGLACVDGTCGALPTSGQPCAQPNLCGPGLACDFTAEGSICVEPKPTGGACQNEAVCGEAGHCSGFGLCAPDLGLGASCDPNLSECAGICARDASFGFSCVAEPGLGDTCIFDDECPDSLACRPKLAEALCIPELCELLR